jgi:hypothetical protein
MQMFLIMLKINGDTGDINICVVSQAACSELLHKQLSFTVWNILLFDSDMQTPYVYSSLPAAINASELSHHNGGHKNEFFQRFHNKTKIFRQSLL